jgi:hypothetical protein
MIEILKISLITFMFCALGQDEDDIFYWYRNMIRYLPTWLYKPLGGCYACFTGQVCLWYFLITKPFDIIELLFFISAGILCAMIWNRIYCYLK